jgi:hypothetical protein
MFHKYGAINLVPLLHGTEREICYTGILTKFVLSASTLIICKRRGNGGIIFC